MLKQILVLLIYSVSGYSQPGSMFKLSGTINLDSGTMRFAEAANLNDYPNTIHFSETPIRNGRFSIEGSVVSPVKIRLIARLNNIPMYVSDGFYLGQGMQAVVCKMDTVNWTREIPEIKNAAMTEYIKRFWTPEYANIDTVALYMQRNDLKIKYIKSYARKYPNSEIALWEIAEALQGGYYKEIDSAYSFLSDSLKNSYTGSQLKGDLEHGRKTGIGSVFPRITAINISGKYQSIILKGPGKKYTLVDFWFSHCGPCISQFPQLSATLDKYHNKGFSIVGISNDQTPENIKAWKKLIQSHGLKWAQYRMGESTAQDLRINDYPTNFLLDGNGIIVAKNIFPEELQTFLEKHLNE